MNEVRIATRRSALALAQAERVADMIRAAHPGSKISLVRVETAGDRDPVGAIAQLTEIGAFVRAVQAAVREHRADLAVHSLKDLPVIGPDDLVLAAFPERASPLDVMVGSPLNELPAGSVVGTGSPRRTAQLAGLRPDLRTAELRGNIETRLRKVLDGDVDAAVLAEAGLARLGRTDAIQQRLAASSMVPAPGQGALAVEARSGSAAAELAATIDDPEIRPLLLVERSLLAETGAGCRSSLGAIATDELGQIRLEAFVADDRGARHIVVHGASPDEVVSEGRKELGL
jgi:hydroxymethylbilane synthase